MRERLTELENYATKHQVAAVSSGIFGVPADPNPTDHLHEEHDDGCDKEGPDVCVMANALLAIDIVGKRADAHPRGLMQLYSGPMRLIKRPRMTKFTVRSGVGEMMVATAL